MKDAWEPQGPPSRFTDDVMSRWEAEKNGPARLRARRVGTWAAAVIAAAACLAIVARQAIAPSGGEIIAADRTEVRLGGRAKAVLEPGAHVTWRGDDVDQPAGDVFYRVEPGASFRVHTPAGDAEVRGTCFRVKVSKAEESDVNKTQAKAGVVGAVLGAAALVAVYEGKVAVSHATDSVTLGAGQSARADATGVHRTDGEGATSSASDADTKEEDPLLRANASLADSVREYKNRLAAVEAEEKTLKTRLSDAEGKLAASENDGQAPSRAERDFNLTQDEWKDLAKEGRVRARIPCGRPSSWDYSKNDLEKLGLAPNEGGAIHDALARSSATIWATLRPLCATALGGSGEMADKLGQSTCQALVLDLARDKGEDIDEETRQAAEARAGMRSPPDAKSGSVLQLLYVLSGASPSLETDLAKTLGPDAAHRVVYSEQAGCWSNSQWDVGPRPQ